MSNLFHSRRKVLLSGVAGATLVAASQVLAAPDANRGAASASGNPLPRMRVRQVRTDYLDIGYHEAGPEKGRPVILLHGFPYDIHSYVDVAPILAARGCRVIVPHLRGHGTTRILADSTPRAGQQAAIGEDVIALMDALHMPEAVLAGYDWGGRAACVVAAVRPSRCVGLVSVNGYLIQDIAHAAAPLAAPVEHGLWYQYYFQTERGRAGLEANRRDIARILWKNNSPSWQFDAQTFARAAEAFDNPDYVDVVIHSYRHRLGLAAGYPLHEATETKLAAIPPIAVPTITLDGTADGVVPATDGKASAARFIGPRIHRQVPGVGHNLPQEAPEAFADAVTELVRGGKWRT
ncbi:2-succinyl-6-hydroxy-2, 4-cyclohexadiene-1-carboxylate synthase [Cupriavidus yeoncheonensis]|uniref:2-succinyl-6-hydroxy-2, 4-cyclohexadiene-1-carboxylate synthase n=2 Tax=Cupriavidus yeoncheonensis TaxID=1462994 RepID=A0A916MXX6_9BURK|nr:alpha/beta hydrolase [Cupriavidus yeoncheonensis]CAG2156047.1 2-succinyl-6-hydroxy-2, 4-cyclohexadiene-1-carboxylate synthase [Cupriavidus yeoncheonensis]